MISSWGNTVCRAERVSDVLGTLVRLSEPDRPSGILAEVLKTVSNMVVLLDEEFLVHSAVHKAIIRLLRSCTGDEFQDKVDGKGKVMGAAAEVPRATPSDYDLDRTSWQCSSYSYRTFLQWSTFSVFCVAAFGHIATYC